MEYPPIHPNATHPQVSESRVVVASLDVDLGASECAAQWDSCPTKVMIHRRPQCLGAATIHWAHTFERLWMEIFDPRVPKMLKLHLPQSQCLVHPLKDNYTCDGAAWLPGPSRMPEYKPQVGYHRSTSDDDEREVLTWPPYQSGWNTYLLVAICTIPMILAVAGVCWVHWLPYETFEM